MKADGVSWNIGLIGITILQQIVHGLDKRIQCYCNTEECLSTNYRCTSNLGKCFSQLAYDPAVGSEGTQHGCIESLPVEDLLTCAGDGDMIKTRKLVDGNSVWPVLMCCKANMCNNVNQNSGELGAHVDERQETDGDFNTGPSSLNDYEETDGFITNSILFQTVAILVPLLGAFILAILVTLAVRWLKDDNKRRRHRALREEALARVQLYVQEHFLTQCPNCECVCEQHCECSNQKISDNVASVDETTSNFCTSKNKRCHCLNSPGIRDSLDVRTNKSSADVSGLSKIGDSVFLLMSTDDATVTDTASLV